MMTKLFRPSLVFAVAAFLAAPASHALIRPDFTPIHLVKESKLIVSVDLKQGKSIDQYDAVIREVLKGKTELKAIHLDLSKARDEQNVDSFRKLAAAGAPALFFVGEFSAQGGGAPQMAGLLSVSGKWASCVGTPDGNWLFDNIESSYQAVWAGGTDMLRRAVDYILTDDEPDMPVSDGVAWNKEAVQIAKLDGQIRSVRPVDLDGDGRLMLFVARDSGDRLLVYDATTQKFTDITEARGLQSKSQAFAWGDFSGQGKLALYSFDGKALSLHVPQADGTFKAQAVDAAAALAGGCVGLSALDGGVKGRASLLVSAVDTCPVLVALGADNKPVVMVLSAEGLDLKKLGAPGACLVADFDGDALADILALRESGSVLFRGLAAGKFAPGVACAVQLGKGPSGACLGDFDADGRLDVLCVNAAGIYVWQNEGAGKFTETLNLCGELAYIGGSGGVDCMSGDVNNDGRQDMLIAYGRNNEASPIVFFNRGFRCFGHAHTLDLAENNLLDAAKQGQQAACLGDFNGDGAQDMALALRNGELWMFFRANQNQETRVALASLPAGGECKGPVTVTGWIGNRCLGAWNVQPGVSQAFICRTDAGPVTLKWRLPGGQEQTKEVVLEKAGTLKVEIK
jgi:hypothetical protein